MVHYLLRGSPTCLQECKLRLHEPIIRVVVTPRNADTAVHLRGVVPRLSSSTLDLLSLAASGGGLHARKRVLTKVKGSKLGIALQPPCSQASLRCLHVCCKAIPLLQNCCGPALKDVRVLSERPQKGERTLKLPVLRALLKAVCSQCCCI